MSLYYLNQISVDNTTITIRPSALLRNIVNVMICMGEETNVSLETNRKTSLKLRVFFLVWFQLDVKFRSVPFVFEGYC